MSSANFFSLLNNPKSISSTSSSSQQHSNDNDIDFTRLLSSENAQKGLEKVLKCLELSTATAMADCLKTASELEKKKQANAGNPAVLKALKKQEEKIDAYSKKAFKILRDIEANSVKFAELWEITKDTYIEEKGRTKKDATYYQDLKKNFEDFQNYIVKKPHSVYTKELLKLYVQLVGQGLFRIQAEGNYDKARADLTGALAEVRACVEGMCQRFREFVQGSELPANIKENWRKWIEEFNGAKLSLQYQVHQLAYLDTSLNIPNSDPYQSNYAAELPYKLQSDFAIKKYFPLLFNDVFALYWRDYYQKIIKLVTAPASAAAAKLDQLPNNALSSADESPQAEVLRKLMQDLTNNAAQKAGLQLDDSDALSLFTVSDFFKKLICEPDGYGDCEIITDDNGKAAYKIKNQAEIEAVITQAGGVERVLLKAVEESLQKSKKAALELKATTTDANGEIITTSVFETFSRTVQQKTISIISLLSILSIRDGGVNDKMPIHVWTNAEIRELFFNQQQPLFKLDKTEHTKILEITGIHPDTEVGLSKKNWEKLELFFKNKFYVYQQNDGTQILIDATTYTKIKNSPNASLDQIKTWLKSSGSIEENFAYYAIKNDEIASKRPQKKLATDNELYLVISSFEELYFILNNPKSIWNIEPTTPIYFDIPVESTTSTNTIHQFATQNQLEKILANSNYSDTFGFYIAISCYQILKKVNPSKLKAIFIAFFGKTQDLRQLLKERDITEVLYSNEPDILKQYILRDTKHYEKTVSRSFKDSFSTYIATNSRVTNYSPLDDFLNNPIFLTLIKLNSDIAKKILNEFPDFENIHAVSLLQRPIASELVEYDVEFFFNFFQYSDLSEEESIQYILLKHPAILKILASGAADKIHTLTEKEKNNYLKLKAKYLEQIENLDEMSGLEFFNEHPKIFEIIVAGDVSDIFKIIPKLKVFGLNTRYQDKRYLIFEKHREIINRYLSLKYGNEVSLDLDAKTRKIKINEAGEKVNVSDFFQKKENLPKASIISCVSRQSRSIPDGSSNCVAITLEQKPKNPFERSSEEITDAAEEIAAKIEGIQDNNKLEENSQSTASRKSKQINYWTNRATNVYMGWQLTKSAAQGPEAFAQTLTFMGAQYGIDQTLFTLAQQQGRIGTMANAAQRSLGALLVVPSGVLSLKEDIKNYQKATNNVERTQAALDTVLDGSITTLGVATMADPLAWFPLMAIGISKEIMDAGFETYYETQTTKLNTLETFAAFLKALLGIPNLTYGEERKSEQEILEKYINTCFEFYKSTDFQYLLLPVPFIKYVEMWTRAYTPEYKSSPFGPNRLQNTAEKIQKRFTELVFPQPQSEEEKKITFEVKPKLNQNEIHIRVPNYVRIINSDHRIPQLRKKITETASYGNPKEEESYGSNNETTIYSCTDHDINKGHYSLENTARKNNNILTILNTERIFTADPSVSDFEHDFIVQDGADNFSIQGPSNAPIRVKIFQAKNGKIVGARNQPNILDLTDFCPGEILYVDTCQGAVFVSDHQHNKLTAILHFANIQYIQGRKNVKDYYSIDNSQETNNNEIRSIIAGKSKVKIIGNSPLPQRITAGEIDSSNTKTQIQIPEELSDISVNIAGNSAPVIVLDEHLKLSDIQAITLEPIVEGMETYVGVYLKIKDKEFQWKFESIDNLQILLPKENYIVLPLTQQRGEKFEAIDSFSVLALSNPDESEVDFKTRIGLLHKEDTGNDFLKISHGIFKNAQKTAFLSFGTKHHDTIELPNLANFQHWDIVLSEDASDDRIIIPKNTPRIAISTPKADLPFSITISLKKFNKEDKISFHYKIDTKKKTVQYFIKINNGSSQSTEIELTETPLQIQNNVLKFPKIYLEYNWKPTTQLKINYELNSKNTNSVGTIKFSEKTAIEKMHTFRIDDDQTVYQSNSIYRLSGRWLMKQKINSLELPNWSDIGISCYKKENSLLLTSTNRYGQSVCFWIDEWDEVEKFAKDYNFNFALHIKDKSQKISDLIENFNTLPAAKDYLKTKWATLQKQRSWIRIGKLIKNHTDKKRIEIDNNKNINTYKLLDLEGYIVTKKPIIENNDLIIEIKKEGTQVVQEIVLKDIQKFERVSLLFNNKKIAPLTDDTDLPQALWEASEYIAPVRVVPEDTQPENKNFLKHSQVVVDEQEPRRNENPISSGATRLQSPIASLAYVAKQPVEWLVAKIWGTNISHKNAEGQLGHADNANAEQASQGECELSLADLCSREINGLLNAEPSKECAADAKGYFFDLLGVREEQAASTPPAPPTTAVGAYGETTQSETVFKVSATNYNSENKEVTTGEVAYTRDLNDASSGITQIRSCQQDKQISEHHQQSVFTKQTCSQAQGTNTITCEKRITIGELYKDPQSGASVKVTTTFSSNENENICTATGNQRLLEELPPPPPSFESRVVNNVYNGVLSALTIKEDGTAIVSAQLLHASYSLYQSGKQAWIIPVEYIIQAGIKKPGFLSEDNAKILGAFINKIGIPLAVSMATGIGFAPAVGTIVMNNASNYLGYRAGEIARKVPGLSNMVAGIYDAGFKLAFAPILLSWELLQLSYLYITEKNPATRKPSKSNGLPLG